MIHDSPLPRLNLWVSRKNLRNHLAGIHSRQAMHVESVVFWVPAMNCLAVKPVPPRDTSIKIQFLGF